MRQQRRKESIITRKAGLSEIQQTSYALQHLLSSYTKAFNKQYQRTGSLFTQNTKCNNISEYESGGFYGIICFHYIHQNPFTAGLVKKMEDWKFSSFSDYINIRSGTLINKKRAIELLDIKITELYEESYSKISEESLKKIL